MDSSTWGVWMNGLANVMNLVSCLAELPVDMIVNAASAYPIWDPTKSMDSSHCNVVPGVPKYPVVIHLHVPAFSTKLFIQVKHTSGVPTPQVLHVGLHLGRHMNLLPSVLKLFVAQSVIGTHVVLPSKFIKYLPDSHIRQINLFIIGTEIRHPSDATSVPVCISMRPPWKMCMLLNFSIFPAGIDSLLPIENWLLSASIENASMLVVSVTGAS